MSSDKTKFINCPNTCLSSGNENNPCDWDKCWTFPAPGSYCLDKSRCAKWDGSRILETNEIEVCTGTNCGGYRGK